MNTFHDAPFLKINDRKILKEFLEKSGITDNYQNKELTVNRVAQAFSRIPYENLTKIIKSQIIVNADSAIRYPDEVIGDWLKWGTGGTCFSLAAAVIAVFDSLGIEAHPVLADRHYGVDTHCGLVIIRSEGLFLLDPGYLLFIPTLVPEEKTVVIDTGYNKIELQPEENCRKIRLNTVVNNNRTYRLTYKIDPVDSVTFYRAWINSFTWEMMTYPVLTRCSAGTHQYLQGQRLSVRSNSGIQRTVLDTSSQIDFISLNLGISKDVVSKAYGVLNYG